MSSPKDRYLTWAHSRYLTAGPGLWHHPAMTKMVARDALDDLIEAIREHQKRNKASDLDIARRIGISRTAWRAIRLGDYRPRLGFAKRCLHLYEFDVLARKALLE